MIELEILAGPVGDSANASLTMIAIITALGGGAIIQALLNWLLRDRKRQATDTAKTDVETKLAYLNTVIERLDAEAKRSLAERDRLQSELTSEQERSSMLRKRVRELEDEIDGVRRAARETQQKCDDLAARLKELVEDAQEPEGKTP